MGKVEMNLETAAAKAGMDAKTARKYRRLGRVPSELTPGPRWRTREDCFQEVWKEVQSLLEVNAGLEAKTIFEYLQRRYAGRFADGQLRTCLFATEETDLRAVLRSGASDETLAATIRQAVWHKELKHYIGDKRFKRANRSMSMIGG